VPRDLAVLVHWVHHPHLGDFLIDTGFDDSFAKHPYGNYTEAMRFFNWVNGITNRQEPGEDLSAQLARLSVHPKSQRCRIRFFRMTSWQDRSHGR